MYVGYGTSFGSQEARLDDRTGTGPFAAHSILRSGKMSEDEYAARLRNRVRVWELILVPWSVLALILISYLLGGSHSTSVVLWLVPIVLVALSGAFVRWHFKAGNNAEVVLGLLCILAVILGLVVGVYAYVRSLKEYDRLSRGAHYDNVLPVEPAGGKSDATTFTFTNFTYVASNKSYGFVDALNPGNAITYCVAPVASGLFDNSRVQYWAAGTDCCEHLRKFKCGDAGKDGAHGAIVLSKESRALHGFQAAIRGAESAHGLQSGDSYILVKWSMDPLAARDALWTSSATLFITFACVYLVVSVLVGCALMPAISTKDV